MNNLYFNRMPIVTGNPQIGQKISSTHKPKESEGPSFQEILDAQRSLVFSKHAVQRVEERGIDLSDSRLSRLEEGARLAEEKGLQSPLILVGETAFLVSLKNNKVITMVDSNELKGSVFTNIDGTVII